MIDKLFPTSIYHEDLVVPDDVQLGMVNYIDRFYEENKHHLQFVPSLTGEVLGDPQISNKEEFKWITEQVSKHCSRYIKMIGATLEPNDIHPGSDLYIPQSWPIVCTNGGNVGYHKHCQSHFSAVFYVKTEENNETGNLIVHVHEPNPLSYLPIFHERTTEYNVKRKKYTPVQNRLFIFPSMLAHEVETYFGNTPRYSISYDILVTTKKDAGNFCLVNPSKRIRIT